jgi:hypothetical protein
MCKAIAGNDAPPRAVEMLSFPGRPCYECVTRLKGVQEPSAMSAATDKIQHDMER